MVHQANVLDVLQLTRLRDNCWGYTQALGHNTFDVGDIKGLRIVRWTFRRRTLVRRLVRYAIYMPSLLFPKATRIALSVPKTVTPHGLSILIKCYLSEHARTKTLESLEAARLTADALLKIHHKSRAGRGWGLPFWFGESPPNLALSHTSQWCLEALIELDSVSPNDELKSEIEKCVTYLLEGLNYTSHSEVALSVSYTEKDEKQVINISADIAAALFRAEKHGCKFPQLAERSRKLAMFVINEQNVDGSWYYNAEKAYGGPSVIDSHHTCMNLRALLYIADQAQDRDLARMCISAATRGLIFFLENLIRGDGLPRGQTNDNKTVSGYACAEMLRTLLIFRRREDLKRELAASIEGALINLLKALDNTMILSSGEVVTQKYGSLDLRVRSLRWPQAYMSLALMEACNASTSEA